MKILVKREQSQTGLNFDEREKIGLKVKRLFQWVMAAILICGATLFASCSNEDNSSAPATNISEKILGKWMYADTDGQPTLTNKKAIYTFVSDTKALMSASLNSHPEAGTQWIDQLEADVVISGNKMTLVNHPDKQTTMVEEFIITDINDSEFNANRKITITADGAVVISVEQVVRFTKVISDYRADIIGTWEGRCTSENSVFDDGQEHRWQYNADGTYVYYVKDGDNWVPYEGNTLNEYFVDGNLLCTRWIDLGQENREWWEITISGDKMNWTALRQKEDGSTFTATFEMKKVE
ncbi:MAG: hypothetical protein IJR69_08180 [Bacteroidaceae bacterium]|nr:hypothetical protein [Bacteroidaceae bacterium]